MKKKSKTKNNRREQYKMKHYDFVDLSDIKLQDSHYKREKMSEFEPDKIRTKMTFNQKFTFSMLTTFLLFNIISAIVEFSYYTQSECGNVKPMRLPQVYVKIENSYREYFIEN